MGSVVISLDAELAWGFHDLADPPHERIAGSRRAWERLVLLFDEFDVPATWAVVGHLFLNECDGEHADHPSVPGWFDRDPGGTAADDDLWFGDGLIEMVRDADAGHEIGSHTFSHVVFADPDTTRDIAAAELAASQRAAADRGYSLRSIVFPRNRIAHRDLLADAGFDCYRGVSPPRWFEGMPLRRVGKFANATVGRRPPPLVRPVVDEYGLVNVPASLYLFDFEGIARSLVESVSDDPVLRWARRGIDAAAAGDGVFHMWLHPNNLANERDFDRMRTVLSYLSGVRARTDLTVETMGEVADRTRTAEATGPSAMTHAN